MTEYYYWSFDPCQCFPQNVPHKCLGDDIPLESGNSCEDDGVVIPSNNIGGCYNSSNALILTKTVEHGTSCKDANGSIVAGVTTRAVSYTHLTLPPIYSV